MECKLANMDHHLKMKTFFAGHTLTIADCAIWITLFLSTRWHDAISTVNYPHLSRWYKYLENLDSFKRVISNHVQSRRTMGIFPELKDAVYEKVIVYSINLLLNYNIII